MARSKFNMEQELQDIEDTQTVINLKIQGIKNYLAREKEKRQK